MSARTKKAKPKPTPGLDRGATGQAMASRTSRTVETLEDGRRATVPVMDDADPLNAMGLTRLQWDVAVYMRDLWRDCLPGLVMPGGYGCRAGHGGKRHLTHDQEIAAGRAWRDWRLAMGALDGQRARRVTEAVIGSVIRDQRAQQGAVKAGLDVLGRYWRMK